MPVDHNLLGSLREHEDPRLGIRERFLTPRIGGGGTIAVLASPLFPPSTMGWVICGSFGMDQVYLLPFEVSLARRLAASGFQVLRYHAQGYGDSQLDSQDASLSSHIQNAVEAVDVLVESAGVSAVGLIGARFGATTAALVAGRVGARGLVLLDPVTSGRRYIQTLIRRALAADLSEKDSAGMPTDPMQTLEETGVLDIEGTEFTRQVLDEISSLELAAALDAFTGRSLVLQLSRSPEVKEDVQTLSAKLVELGGGCELDVIADPDSAKFGLPRYRRAGEHKVDVQSGLVERLISRTVSWCAGFAVEATV